MADNPTDTNPDTEAPTIESVVEIAPDKLSDDQKTLLREKADDLTDEQKETFKDVLEAKDEKPEDIDPEKVEIETRTKEPEKKPDDKESEAEEDEVDPEDKKNIGKVVDDKLTDFRGKLDEVDKIKDQVEVDGYIRDNPDFKPYRGVILKHLAHPAYKNIPVKNIAKMVAGDDLLELGAKKEREADQKAKDTQGGGTTIRKPGGGVTDWSRVSSEEFLRKKNEVLGIR